MSAGALLVLFGVYVALQAAGARAEFFGGDKWGILMPLCLGLPLGSVAGIVIAERGRREPLSRVGLVISVFTALGGICIAVAAMDLFGVAAIFLAPLITTAAGYAGFRIASCISTRLKLG